MTDDLEMARDRWDCCDHCEHDINDPPHDRPCAEGCNDAENDDDE